MSWESAVAEIFDGLFPADAPGVATMKAHLARIAEGTAKELEPPRDEIESDEQLLEMRDRWVRWLAHGELFAALGLGPSEALLVELAGEEPASALRGEGGELLALRGGPAAVLAEPLVAEMRARGKVIVVGPADRLWAFAQAMVAAKLELPIERAFVDHLPLMPAAAKLVHERLGVPVGEALRDPGGGWLALSRRLGELLVQVRRGEQFVVCGRGGEFVPEGRWGLLGVIREGKPGSLPVWARQQQTREGVPGLQVGMPETPLPTVAGRETNTLELHNRLGPLPLFAYQLYLAPEAGGELRVSVVPGDDEDVAEAEAQIRDAVEGVLLGVELVFAPPASEFEGMRIVDERAGELERMVTVMWAGEPGSSARLAAWREGVIAAGVQGPEDLELVDAQSGEAVDDAEEVTKLLEAEPRLPLPPELIAAREGPRVVALGDPRGSEVEARGFLCLLEADERREAMIVSGVERESVARIVEFFDSGEAAPEIESLALIGVHMHPFSRPTLARAREDGSRDPLWLDPSRCVGSGDCKQICPTDAIELVTPEGDGHPRPVIDKEACIRCHLCSERCDAMALRPYLDDEAFLDGRILLSEVERIRGLRDRARPRTLEGKLAAPPLISRKPTVVLGLATVTLMEHAAALLVDGQLVSAIEEERLTRVRHYTYRHPERPGTSLSSDLALRVEEAWPPRAIDYVLKSAGMTMDDVDVVAINGIPARLRHSFVGGGSWRPPPVLRANSLVFVPHHMAHAASTYGLSGYDDAWILSVDGRGDYETATVWRAEGHALEVVDAVPWLPDCSFGGVYETVTRVLGFGTHGQGSTMALAALGEPDIDLSECMGMDQDGRPVLSEWNTEQRFRELERSPDDPMTDAHRNLAASVQLALETTVGDYLEAHAGELEGTNLALCGGVALNCKMNGVLRERFSPAAMHVPPGANDAGTAIGSAMVGHRELTGELPRLDLGHTHLGPQWSDEAIAKTLQRMRVPFQRLRKVGEQVAELLAAGKVLCWFQGPMEFGPRALGGRSIIADPRREEHKARMNTMKSREPWRPFGPSILAGRQGEWFEQDWDSRFMLFAVTVKEDKRAEIPVVVHYDGSSRPQVVHRGEHPRYYEMIEAFEARTGVPMVVNTSFNRGGEPIVCNPVEALRSFVGLGADAIVLGNCLVRREMLRR